MTGANSSLLEGGGEDSSICKVGTKRRSVWASEMAQEGTYNLGLVAPATLCLPTKVPYLVPWRA